MTSEKIENALITAQVLTRRDMLATGALAGGAMLLRARTAMAQDHGDHPPTQPPPTRGAQPGTQPEREPPPHDEHFPPGEAGADYTPVVVPNGWTLPYKIVDGVKVFHLVAEEVAHEFAPGLKAICWGYNGGVHGPVIEAVEGDRVRVFVTNRLPAATTIHWHAMLLPSGMDGVGGLSQKAIQPGETFMYEFTLIQHGTMMYHSHHDEMTQMGMGLTGVFVVHPRPRNGEGKAGGRVDRDFVILLHEWRIEPGASRPDPNEMTDFNILTFNAKVFPGTQPLVTKAGDRVRIRIGNLGAMNHHPIHLHGHHFTITETDGGMIPEAGRWPESTVLVPVGSTRTIEFTAIAGDWALHCHMTHHLMNQMGEKLVNMIGVDTRGLDTQVRGLLPGYMTMGTTGMVGMHEMSVPTNSIPMLGGVGPKDEITMGGMFTILKVRDNLSSYQEDPGWYDDPPGTLAALAADDALRRNEIANDGSSAPRAPAAAMKPWGQAKPPQEHAPTAPARHDHGSHPH
jgi:FtsP/CotA-like multicopper oxidase with cupredoxin domain